MTNAYGLVDEWHDTKLRKSTYDKDAMSTNQLSFFTMRILLLQLRYRHVPPASLYPASKFHQRNGTVRIEIKSISGI